MKSLNVRLVVILLASTLVLVVGAYFLRSHFVHSNAESRLVWADEAEARAELARQDGNLEQAAEEYKSALDNLASYVNLIPEDIDVRQRLGLLRADLVLNRDAELRQEVRKQMPRISGRAIATLEGVLREDPGRVDARRRLFDIYATSTARNPELYQDVKGHFDAFPKELQDDGELLATLGR